MVWVIAGLNKKRPGLSIRSKLLLVSAVLFVLPWAGGQYIQDMENYLRKAQQDRLLARAQLVAAVLDEQQDIFQPRGYRPAQSGADETPAYSSHLYVRPLKRPIQLDGYLDDWLDFSSRAQSMDSPWPSSISYRYFIGSYGKHLYLVFDVRDDVRVYRQPGHLSVVKNDHLHLVLRDREGQLQHYIIATLAPGWVNAQRVEMQQEEWRVVAPEYRIKGEWQESAEGYTLEIRIPLSLIGDQLSFFIADVDDVEKTEDIHLLGNAPSLDRPGSIIVSSPAMEALLRKVQRPASRTWVIDGYFRVLGVVGDIKQRVEDGEQRVGLLRGAVRFIYHLLLKQPAEDFTDELSEASYLQNPAVKSALQGRAATSWRDTPDKRVRILTAAWPIRKADKTLGVVAIEETSNAILILQNRAMEKLINLSVLTFLVTVIVLLGYATYLSLRILRLRNQIEKAISPEGRIKGQLSRSSAADEIGDLSRSFADMLERLAEYNRYLEGMAGRLSHELRTPITVVRSSLENLQSTRTTEEKQTYLQRASEGVERLSNILSRMSEASRLEQTLQSEKPGLIDLCQLVENCVSGYRLAYAEVDFEIENTVRGHCRIHASAELIAQMLDKLIANAVDFHLPKTAVCLKLSETEKQIRLSVQNQGPPLPEQMRNNLFESMVSVRSKRGEEPHLGLGLYIVKLIAEFHQAELRAENLHNNRGVEITILFAEA